MNSKHEKTPGEWLLTRHRSAGSTLDRIRRDAIGGATAKAERVGITDFPALLHALFYPQRFVWTAILAVWVALAVVQLSQPREPSSPNAIPPAVIAAWFGQQNSHEIFAQTDSNR